MFRRKRYGKKKIVEIKRTAYGREMTYKTYYAIRRECKNGYIRPQKWFEYLKLNDLENPQWTEKDRTIQFWEIYATDNPEVILNVWNHEEKSEREKMENYYGTVIDPCILQKNCEEIESDLNERNRFDRIGINE